MDEQRRLHLLARYREHADAFDQISKRRSGRRKGSFGSGYGQIQRRTLNFAAHQASAKSSGLTARELEVLKLIAGGASNKEIAFELRLSQETIKSHVKNLLSALGAATRAEAVTVGFCRGILRALAA